MRIGGVFFRIYSAFLLLTGILGVAFYFITLPWLKGELFEIERRNSQTLLSNTTTVIRSYQQELQNWRDQITRFRKSQLKSKVTAFQRQLASLASTDVEPSTAQKQAIQMLASIHSGDDYIWVADYQGNLIFDPVFMPSGGNGPGLTEARKPVLKKLVQMAREHQFGFLQYPWPRLSATKDEMKLAYVRALPVWRWVIGSGIYVSDIDKQMADRKKQMLDQIRQLLKSTPIGKSGYMYIFNEDRLMVVHPDTHLEGVNVGKMIDQASGRPLADEIVEASRRSGVLEYMWNRPEDPKNYRYRKIAWVKSIPELGWYVSTSVYQDDLYARADQLAKRLLISASIVILLLLAVAAFLARRFSLRLEKMARVSQRIADGNLGERLESNRRDEIGELGRAFNQMVAQLESNMGKLEEQVGSRTHELSERVAELKLRTEDERVINRLVTFLQGCTSREDIYRVVAHVLSDWMTDIQGCLWIMDEPDQGEMKIVSSWGGFPNIQITKKPKNCFACRQQEPFSNYKGGASALCECQGDGDPENWSLCLPLLHGQRAFAVLQLVFPRHYLGFGDAARQKIQQRCQRLLDPLSLGLQNFYLKERLELQSIMDSLTGLYNRRFLDDNLSVEVSRCERAGQQLVVVLCDADHFKRVNDEFGHQAGDRVLAHLATMMQMSVRESDLVCRYGGEEFILILPNISPEQAREKAEALRQRVEQAHFVVNDDGLRIHLTLSIGLAWYPDIAQRPGDLVRAADMALYQAKKSGQKIRSKPGRNSGYII